MSCLTPIFIKGLKDAAGHDVPCVPCGKCIECLKAKRRDWFFRNKAEWKSSTSAYFITLTYDDDHLPQDNGKRDLQLFMKRLRKSRKEKLSFFGVNETGDQHGRLHFHILLYNLDIKSPTSDDVGEVSKIIEKSWSKGFVSVAKINESRINYVCKYCLKRIQEDHSGYFFYSARGGLQLVSHGLQIPDDLTFFLNVMGALVSLPEIPCRSRVITSKRSSEELTVKIELNLPLTRDLTLLRNLMPDVVRTVKSGQGLSVILYQPIFLIVRRMIFKGSLTVNMDFWSKP